MPRRHSTSLRRDTQARHEIAEAATDPNVNFRALGWYDDYNGGEIGDINRYEALLNGYAVQSIVNKYDVAYVPYGATTLRALDAVSGSGFASHSGHPAPAGTRFGLPPAGWAGRAPTSDTPFARPADSLSFNAVEAPENPEELAWFSLIVGACPHSLTTTWP